MADCPKCERRVYHSEEPEGQGGDSQGRCRSSPACVRTHLTPMGRVWPSQAVPSRFSSRLAREEPEAGGGSLLRTPAVPSGLTPALAIAAHHAAAGEGGARQDQGRRSSRSEAGFAARTPPPAPPSVTWPVPRAASGLSRV